MPIEVQALDFSDPGHREALAQLLVAFSSDEAIAGKGMSDDTAHAAVAGLADRHPRAWVALAWDRDAVGSPGDDAASPGHTGGAAGMVITIESYSTFQAAPVLNLHDVAVSSKYRRRGIGRMLIQAARDEAERRGCCKMTLEAFRENAAAIALYRDVGFRSPGEGTATGETLFFALPIPS
ncbi:MAG: N-acetyltransferase [Planctomycetota bacterium]